MGVTGSYMGLVIGYGLFNGFCMAIDCFAVGVGVQVYNLYLSVTLLLLICMGCLVDSECLGSKGGEFLVSFAVLRCMGDAG